jgi:hypothetical protein
MGSFFVDDLRRMFLDILRSNHKAIWFYNRIIGIQCCLFKKCLYMEET